MNTNTNNIFKQAEVAGLTPAEIKHLLWVLETFYKIKKEHIDGLKKEKEALRQKFNRLLEDTPKDDVIYPWYESIVKEGMDDMEIKFGKMFEEANNDIKMAKAILRKIRSLNDVL